MERLSVRVMSDRLLGQRCSRKPFQGFRTIWAGFTLHNGCFRRTPVSKTPPRTLQWGQHSALEKTDFQQTFSSFIFLICKGTSRAWRQGFKINPLPVRTGASKHLKFGDLSVALLRIRRQKRLSTGQFLAQPFRNLGWIAPIEGAMAQG